MKPEVPVDSVARVASDARDERAWVALDVRGFHWRCWQDEHVLYSALTGDTHLVDRFTALLLKTLQRGPATTAELRDLLTREMPGGQLDSLSQLLSDLYKLGLVDVFRGDCR